MAPKTSIDPNRYEIDFRRIKATILNDITVLCSQFLSPANANRREPKLARKNIIPMGEWITAHYCDEENRMDLDVDKERDVRKSLDAHKQSKQKGIHKSEDKIFRYFFA